MDAILNLVYRSCSSSSHNLMKPHDAVTESIMCSCCSPRPPERPGPTRRILVADRCKRKSRSVFKRSKSGGYYFRPHTQTTNCGRSHPGVRMFHVMSANRSYLPQYCSSVSPLLLCVPSPSIKFESRVKHVLHNFVIPWLERPPPIRNFLQMEGRETPSHRYWSLATKT